GSVLLYVLVATIGMQMDLGAIFDSPVLFLVGIVWMIVHILVMLIVAYIIKAPFFYVAVGSQANVGGAASAPIVASAFDSSLAPVGVLLAVLGYAVGTYGAYICGLMMQNVSGM
ncbi:MAG: putative membrane protein, partial [Algoriphagus sp.]